MMEGCVEREVDLRKFGRFGRLGWYCWKVGLVLLVSGSAFVVG